MKKEPIKHAPDMEMCFRCKHGKRSFRRGRLPDVDPDNKLCSTLPFAFMPIDNGYDVICTMYEEMKND